MIAETNPRISKVYRVYQVLENHLIVIVTFFVYLLVIYTARRSFLNLGSLLLILVLMASYFNNGLSQLLKYWNVITVYQAMVLLTLVVF